MTQRNSSSDTETFSHNAPLFERTPSEPLASELIIGQVVAIFGWKVDLKLIEVPPPPWISAGCPLLKRGELCGCNESTYWL